MPDMAYTTAYKAYAMRDTTQFTMDPDRKGGKKIFYDARPVAGTVSRGDTTALFELPHDSTGYRLSAGIKNPIERFSSKDLVEAKRLYNVNCAICHGEKGTADGPIAASGHIGGVANLTLDNYKQMADGTMFYSITYGKNNMGSYASQLTREQRWMVIKYVRSLQE